MSAAKKILQEADRDMNKSVDKDEFHTYIVDKASD